MLEPSNAAPGAASPVWQLFSSILVESVKMRACRKTRVRSFYDPTTHSPRLRGFLRAPHTRRGLPGCAGALQCRPRSGQSHLVTVFFDSGGIIENACRQENSSSPVLRPYHAFSSHQRVPEGTPHPPRPAWTCRSPPMPPQVRPVRFGNFFIAREAPRARPAFHF